MVCKTILKLFTLTVMQHFLTIFTGLQYYQSVCPDHYHLPNRFGTVMLENYALVSVLIDHKLQPR